MVRQYNFGSSFGAMQGRLSTQTERGYQAFPWETWAKEFDFAVARNLEHIEWVLDSWSVSENPLLTDTKTVLDQTIATGVNVVSVCADYLMDQPLDVSEEESWNVLDRLVVAMQELGANWLVVPCVDHSSLRDSQSMKRFVKATMPLAEALGGTGIQVSLETDLGPSEFARLLADLDPAVFGVNYDIGNSASLGYSHYEEFDAYGDRITLVHIKDRVKGGGSVPLGQGDANIPEVIDHLRFLKFNGPVTMQSFRDIQGLDILDEQLHWLQPMLTAGP